MPDPGWTIKPEGLLTTITESSSKTTSKSIDSSEAISSTASSSKSGIHISSFVWTISEPFLIGIPLRNISRLEIKSETFDLLRPEKNAMTRSTLSPSWCGERW